jgi:hypothetical protein
MAQQSRNVVKLHARLGCSHMVQKFIYTWHSVLTGGPVAGWLQGDRSSHGHNLPYIHRRDNLL